MSMFKTLSARKRGAAIEFLTRISDKATSLGAIRMAPLKEGGTVKFHHLKEWCRERNLEVTQQGSDIVIAKAIPQNELVDALADAIVGTTP